MGQKGEISYFVVWSYWIWYFIAHANRYSFEGVRKSRTKDRVEVCGLCFFKYRHGDFDWFDVWQWINRQENSWFCRDVSWSNAIFLWKVCCWRPHTQWHQFLLLCPQRPLDARDKREWGVACTSFPCSFSGKYPKRLPHVNDTQRTFKQCSWQNRSHLDFGINFQRFAHKAV